MHNIHDGLIIGLLTQNISDSFQSSDIPRSDIGVAPDNCSIALVFQIYSGWRTVQCTTHANSCLITIDIMHVQLCLSIS